MYYKKAILVFGRLLRTLTKSSVCKAWISRHTYLDQGFNRDQEGGSPRKRPFHCTSVRLTPASRSNVTTLGSQFLLVGSCVRASPCKLITTNCPFLKLMIRSMWSLITYFEMIRNHNHFATHDYKSKKWITIMFNVSSTVRWNSLKSTHWHEVRF